jgi:hypothetical protein
MQERARALRGTLQIASSDQGTCITLMLPVPAKPRLRRIRSLYKQIRSSLQHRAEREGRRAFK